MVAEKESLMAQYESIAEQMAVIDQVQKPLLQESNEVKKKVEEFDGQRQVAQVRACPPCLFFPIHLSFASRVELRRPLNSGWWHRMSNIIGRRNSLRRRRRSGPQRNSWILSNKSSRSVEYVHHLAISHGLGFRIGQEEQSSTAIVSLIPGRSQSFSAT